MISLSRLSSVGAGPASARRRKAPHGLRLRFRVYPRRYPPRGWRCALRPQAGSGGQHYGEARDHRVAGTGHVEHLGLAGHGRDRCGFALGKQSHPMFAAGEEKRLEAELVAQALGAPLEVLFVLPGADHPAQLVEVRGDDAHALVARIVVTLRIGEHAPAGLARRAHHLRDVREAPFAVVGENHSIAFAERALEFLELGREHLARRGLLEIDAQELLLAADDAQLLRRVELVVAVQARLDALLLDQLLELPARPRAPHHRETAGGGPGRPA